MRKQQGGNSRQGTRVGGRASTQGRASAQGRVRADRRDIAGHEDAGRDRQRSSSQRPTRSVTVTGGQGLRRQGGTRLQANRAQEDVVQSAESPNLLIGRRPVLEALKSGRPINKMIVAEAAEGGSLQEILGKARAAGIVIQTAPRASLTRLAGDAHQGVIAYVSPHEYVELEEVMKRKTGNEPLVILLDEIADPYNLGAILRTAEATGAQGVVIPKRRAVPLTETVAKAAAGAVEYVPVARVANLVQAIEKLKAAGYWIVGADANGETMFTEVDYRGNIALVIGAEDKGLSRLVRESCDYLVKLPMRGQLASLNASVATGVFLYEIVRQRS